MVPNLETFWGRSTAILFTCRLLVASSSLVCSLCAALRHVHSFADTQLPSDRFVIAKYWHPLSFILRLVPPGPIGTHPLQRPCAPCCTHPGSRRPLHQFEKEVKLERRSEGRIVTSYSLFTWFFRREHHFTSQVNGIFDRHMIPYATSYVHSKLPI